MTQLTLKDNGTKKMKQRSIAMSLYVTYVCKTIPRYMTDHHQGPFCTPHSICLNISFWQSSFVWKCCIKRSKYWNEIRRTSALSVIFKMKTLRKIAFLCQDKNQRQFCRKLCWNVKRNNHLFLSIWQITFFKHLYSLIMWK